MRQGAHHLSKKLLLCTAEAQNVLKGAICMQDAMHFTDLGAQLQAGGIHVIQQRHDCCERLKQLHLLTAH